MYGAVFLDVAAIFYDYAAPITTKGCARTDVYILTYDYIARNSGLRMDECGGMDNGYEAFEGVKHSFSK